MQQTTGGSSHCHQTYIFLQTMYLASLQVQGSKLQVEAAIVVRHIFFFGLPTLLVYDCKAANHRWKLPLSSGI
eukprot:9775187-Ditylum_brightwellii.AAC.1